jgi:murein DD-endopeptidase MepM/ murein hydrolase activator NlpD
MMNRTRSKAVFTGLFFSVLVLNGCASGRTYAEGRTRSARAKSETVRDRIPAKQSSYRIRGTDETGILTDVQKEKLRAKTRAWRWPTNDVRVTSIFGTRKGEHHDGIDLRASSGTPVYAAFDGKVIYAGSKISGYGRMIVLRHAGKLSTIYAHNSKLQVRPGQTIRRGQLIAYSGNTGRSSGPHLHFEIREGVTAINPMILLPSPVVANEANRRMANAGEKSGARKRSGRVKSTASSARRPAPAKSRYSQSSATRADQPIGGRIAARVAEDDGFQPRSPRAKRVH